MERNGLDITFPDIEQLILQFLNPWERLAIQQESSFLLFLFRRQGSMYGYTMKYMQNYEEMLLAKHLTVFLPYPGQFFQQNFCTIPNDLKLPPEFEEEKVWFDLKLQVTTLTIYLQEDRIGNQLQEFLEFILAENKEIRIIEVVFFPGSLCSHSLNVLYEAWSASSSQIPLVKLYVHKHQSKKSQSLLNWKEHPDNQYWEVIHEDVPSLCVYRPHGSLQNRYSTSYEVWCARWYFTYY